MSKLILYVLSSFILFTSAIADAAPGPVGLGIILGEPTALTGKFWIEKEKAIDVGLAFSFDDYALVYGDYLLHFPGMLGRSSPVLTQMTPYLGVGGILAFAKDRNSDRDRRFFGRRTNSVALGLRIPLGIEWIPARPPLGVFIELVPGITLIPETSGLFEGGLGVRYYF